MKADPKKYAFVPLGLVLLYAMDGLARIGPALFAPIIAVYVLALGGSVLHLGELGALFSIAYAITGFAVSKKFLGARYSLMSLSYGLMFVYSVLLLYADSISFLYVVILLGGVATALRAPPFTNISFDHVDQTLYVKASSFYRILIALLGALFGYIGATLVHHSGSPLPHESGDITVFKQIFITMSILFGTTFLFSLAYRARFKRFAESDKQKSA